ncbi:MAG TPA: hypothetical protein VFI41_05250 [Gemmatimonadales bacterium]|nr:hypothetical protein [Gemmatimonadales bacterium]
MTGQELLEALQPAIDRNENVRVRVNQWLARGDGVAVYENVELGHPDAGHRQYVSYGSPEAQIPDAFPPSRMPDIGGSINWRYALVGAYRGEAL